MSNFSNACQSPIHQMLEYVRAMYVRKKSDWAVLKSLLQWETGAYAEWLRYFRARLN